MPSYFRKFLTGLWAVVMELLDPQTQTETGVIVAGSSPKEIKELATNDVCSCDQAFLGKEAPCHFFCEVCNLPIVEEYRKIHICSCNKAHVAPCT